MTALAPIDPVRCRHCGLRMDAGEFCCAGCEQAAAIISAAGLDRYYEERAAFAPRPLPSTERYEAITVEAEGDLVRARLAVDGLRCASCVWVVEKVLERTPGVRDATVSYGTGRASIGFDPDRVDVATLAGTIAALGYHPRPLSDAAIDVHDRDLLVRLGVAAFVAMNVMLISVSVYAGWWSGMEARYAVLFRWTSLALSTPAALWCAVPFYQGAWAGLRRGVLHMDLPVSLGIGILYTEGVVATLFGVEAYFDSLTMLVALLLGGRVVEARGRKHAREAAESLAAQLPHSARRVRADGGLEVVGVDELAVGDRIDVASGEEIGADGEIESGRAQVRMALVTGESEPIDVGRGDAVVAGGLVSEGSLRVRVTATGAATLLERMAEDLRNATDREPKGTLPDRIAPYFTTATLATATLTFAGWTWAAGPHEALAHTVAVLVVACPCALALAQPLAVAAGLGAAARRGLLVRSGDALLALGEADVVALDKTGTVTGGTPVVVDASDEDLRVAAGLERFSVHPVARAVLDEAERRGIAIATGRDVVETAGRGIRGLVDGKPTVVRAGGPGELELVHGDHTGRITLRDAARPDAVRTVHGLRQAGLRVALLTGDHAVVAARIGEAVGVPEVHARVEPLDKAAWIRREREGGHRVLFVGDGLNDGPALAAADISVAMGSGAASSVLVADAVIGQVAIAPVLAGVRAGRAAKRAIRANLSRSLVYNVAAVAFAAAGFVNPLVAALLMPLSSAMVLFGASRVERAVAREDRWTA